MNKKVLINCLLTFSIALLLSTTSFGQTRVRLSANYTKEMGKQGQIDIKARAKIDGKMQAVKQVDFQVYRWYEDTTIYLGSIRTNEEGRSSFMIDQEQVKYLDTTSSKSYQIKLQDHEEYKDVERTVTFMEANLAVDVVIIDSIPHFDISFNNGNGEGIADQGIMLTANRLFKPYSIGEEVYYTEADGSLLIPYEDDLPGVNNYLEFIVTTEEGDYGTIYKNIHTAFGTEVELESTFDDRTMWSPPHKTPWVLLIFPNLIILGVWFTILILILNLYKISKS